MGHIDIPQAERRKLGAVIVPPFGWEDVCSYRPLRCLGQTLAANGIPTLRFDLPGTGDSSGSALDSGLVDSWIESVFDAAAELRVSADVENVAVVGIGLGAMLAIAAAARGANLQCLVLWGTAATGRAQLRELRAFNKMELSEYGKGVVVPPQPIPGLEIAGFLLAPETQRLLESLDFSILPQMHKRRALVLSRDDIRPDAKLVRALEASDWFVEVGIGSGYAAMLAPPHEVVHPTKTFKTIVEFLAHDLDEAGPLQKAGLTVNSMSTRRAAPQSAVTVVEGVGTCVLETVYSQDHSSASLFGILSEPGPGLQRSDLCLLFLNPGAVRHIGPNRMWVEAARRWAARGVMSLRMDFAGIGESDGESSVDVAGLYTGQFLEQIELVMDALRSRAGARHFAVIGLCSGAFWAFHAAIRHPNIRGAILLNPRCFFWDVEVDRHRILRRSVNGVTDMSSWHRLVRGEITPARISKAVEVAFDTLRKTRCNGNKHYQIPPKAMADAWAAIENNQSRVILVFTEGEPLLLEMEEEGHLPLENGARFRCVRIPNCGHTFRPVWAQQVVHELIDRELEVIIRECHRPD